jgi:hypothetical protein
VKQLMQANTSGVLTLPVADGPNTPPGPARRRVRTASSRIVEFLYVFDVYYAPAAAAALTAPLSLFVPMRPIAVALVFAALTVVCFLFFWLSLINCNPYPPDLTRAGQLARIPNVLPFTEVTRRSDLTNLQYPLIFKPSLCSTNSSGVALIESAEQARRYMAVTKEEMILAQAFHPGEEFTIMWERWPWQARGCVRAVFWRKKTHAPGEFHPLSGAGTPKVTLAAQHLRTKALLLAAERSVRALDNVYCTRLDVRADGPEELARGNFWVMESNGVIGVPGGGLLGAALVSWPRRIITGAYNIFTHENASVHPRVLVHRMRRFLELGGWDFRICDGF